MRTPKERERAIQAARKAVELLGGPALTARRLKVKDNRHQTVQSWMRTGVPAHWAQLIETETGGRVTRQQLRPADWHLLWPNLLH